MAATTSNSRLGLFISAAPHSRLQTRSIGQPQFRSTKSDEVSLSSTYIYGVVRLYCKMSCLQTHKHTETGLYHSTPTLHNRPMSSGWDPASCIPNISSDAWRRISAHSDACSTTGDRECVIDTGFQDRQAGSSGQYVPAPLSNSAPSPFRRR